MTLPPFIRTGGRVVATLVLIVAALFAGRWLWIHYQIEPWTRDGRVRADVAQIAPDVSGLVTEVYVSDNREVHKGDKLFTIDRSRYELALQQAEAAIQQSDANLQAAEAAVQVQTVQLAQAKREDARNRQLGSLVSTETGEQSNTKVEQIAAALAQARASVAQVQAAAALAQTARDTAKLNLDRTLVTAPVDGVAANVELRPGDYLTAGKAAFGIVDSASLHVDAYLEETKLRYVRPGDPVTVELMGDGRILQGHVESIAPGIEDRERGPSGNLLANINPTFNWVRLAQRIPVRIHLDRAPPDLLLIAGRTTTVVIHPANKSDEGKKWP